MLDMQQMSTEHLLETDMAPALCDVTIRPPGGLVLKTASDHCLILNVKHDIVLKRQTLYECEVKKSKNFLFAGRSFHTHTTCGKAIVV
jgi:hypothetical protein